MDNSTNAVLTRDTTVSANFLALPADEGFTFAGHPYGQRGLISLGRAVCAVTREHPSLTRCGELWAADLVEARAILSTLEAALRT